MPSAGCVFKNPPNDSAGRLLEAVGFKGLRVGDAEVSLKHANFMVNRGHATAADVIGLIGEGPTHDQAEGGCAVGSRT